MTEAAPIPEEWPEETKDLARQMADCGRQWKLVNETKADLSRRRIGLFVALERVGVSHSMIARLAGQSKGAVEMALVAHRKKNDA